MTDFNETNSRRNFLKTSAAGLAALTIMPSGVIAGLGHRAPSDKLAIAAVGVGGVGFRNLTNLRNESIVALCDVDGDYGMKAFRRWPDARRYKDFRVMLETEKNIDGVVIATPDHTHSIAAMAAMQLQKHVFVQAPMAHAVFEMRRMTESARVFNVITQVGNQSASGNPTREIAELIWSGAIGEIREVHAYTSQPIWKQGELSLDKSSRQPKELDWNLFLGPCAETPFHSTYTPFGWRAFWKFGNGALGSMGPHVLEPAFRALKLKAPVQVEASSTTINMTTAPTAQKLVFSFARRDNLPKLALPAVKLYWYDGGLLPEKPVGIPEEIKLGATGGGLIFVGDEGSIICEEQGSNYKVVKNGNIVDLKVDQLLHRIEDPFAGGHENDWVRACKENPENRLVPSADFDSQAAITETILVGAIAVRLQSLHKKLEWDSAQMRFLNINQQEEFEITTPQEMVVENGIPKFANEIAKYNAYRFVEQTVRPIYREGWKQI
jgi:predicted dehydrogenase